jgi:predicted lipoprotein with Yx(FWY)xxD motif
MRKLLTLVLAMGAVAFALAGCGGGSHTGSGAARAAVSISHGKAGTYLTDSEGRALYLFAADKSANSTCYSACATLWPPLTTHGTPRAGAGVSAALLATTRRSDGTREVTYKGHPLYYYAGDSHAGQTTGQGVSQFGAKWYLVAGNGSAIQ